MTLLLRLRSPPLPLTSSVSQHLHGLSVLVACFLLWSAFVVSWLVIINNPIIVSVTKPFLKGIAYWNYK